MNIIKKLPQNLVNLIAAGEVVERPASALKELMENSIDAGANKIIVKIGGAGIEYIQVEDNGSGMSKEDTIMAFEQHATSKISSEEDLNNIYTLGFRGEALASISSVCQQMSIDTRTKSEPPNKVIKSNNQISIETSQKSDQGTIVRIEGLFENIPARKKFLKSEQSEFKHLAQTFLNTALPNLSTHFELWHNNKEIYKLTKVSSFKDRVFEIWGNNISKHIFEPTEYTSAGLKVTAFLGSTEIGRKSGDIQYIFVNQRCISNKTIYQAAVEGYRGFLHKDLKPTYFYFLEVDPKEVDVNIHPRKNEVRFNNNQLIFQAIYSITKRTLENSTRSLISNTINTAREDSLKRTEPSGQTSQEENIYKYESFTESLAKDQIGVSYKNTIQNANSGSSKNYLPSKNESGRTTYKPNVQDALSFTKLLLNKESSSDEVTYLASNNQFESLSPFQLFNTYIIFEKEQKIIFVDQHAAAEKITFENLYKNYGAIKTKPLLVADIINLRKHEKNEVLARKNELANSGIIIEDFGGDSIQVLEIPEIIERIDINYYLQEILNPSNDFSKTFNTGEYNNLTYEAYILLATEACHGSIRAGQKLSQEEMKKILKNLLTLQNPYNCPHGRPVMWELERDEIEKNFKRKL